MKILNESLEKVNDFFTKLRLNAELAKGLYSANKVAKSIGSESMNVTVVEFLDNSNESYYDIETFTVEYIDEKLYKKTTRKYKIPSSIIREFNYTIADINYLFADYLEDIIETYTNDKNEIVDYQPKITKHL